MEHSTFNCLKKFFPLICDYDVLSTQKLANMCVEDENNYAVFPRLDRARDRAELIKRLFEAVRAWCSSELVYSYLFSGDNSIKECWESVKDVREITLGTAKAEVQQHRGKLDLRYFPSVEVKGRIEHVNVSDEQTIAQTEKKLNIAEYLFDYCVLIDERLVESRELISVFNQQLSKLEDEVFGRVSYFGSGGLQRSFDIELGKFMNGNKKRYEVSPERFRLFLSVLRPYSRAIKKSLEKKMYCFSDCLSYMDFLRIGVNLTPEEKQLRRELLSVLDGHNGAAILDRVALADEYEITSLVGGDEEMLLGVTQVPDEDELCKAILEENKDEVARQAAFVGFAEKSLKEVPMTAPKSTDKKRGPKPQKPKTVIDTNYVPDDSEVVPETVPEMPDLEKEAADVLANMLDSESTEMPTEIKRRRLSL